MVNLARYSLIIEARGHNEVTEFITDQVAVASTLLRFEDALVVNLVADSIGLDVALLVCPLFVPDPGFFV